MAILKRREERTTARKPAKWFVDFVNGGGKTTAGVTVTPDSAMTYTAVWAAVTLIAQTVATLPIHLYQKDKSGDRKRVVSPESQVIGVKPNPVMTAYDFWQTIIGLLAMRGNSYAEIVRFQNGRVKELWPIDPTKMRLEWNNDRTDINYIWNEQVEFPSNYILHFRSFSLDGIVGRSTITANKEQIALGMGATRYAGAFYENDATPSGLLKHPGELGEEGQKLIKKSFKKAHSKGKAHSIAILEEGMEWETIGISPEDSQLIETLTDGVRAVARMYHIPPHKLQEMSAATFSNIEHQGIEFLTDTIMPWLTLQVSEINNKLLTDGVFAEHTVESLLKGDIKTRYEAYRTGIFGGFLTRNEARRLENLNSIPGLDDPLVPMNMTTASLLGQGQNNSRILPKSSTWNLVRDAVSVRIVGKELSHIGKAKNDTQIEDFYKGYAEHIRKVMGPYCQALAEQTGSEIDVDGWLLRYADQVVDESKGIIYSNGDRMHILSRWETGKADRITSEIIEGITGGENEAGKT